MAYRAGTRRILGALLVAVLCIAGAQDAYAQKQKKSNKSQSNPLYASIVIDADTGMVISERYPDKKLHPASLTKAMTLMIMFDALNNGRAKLDDRIYVSKHAASMVPSKLNLPVGSSIRVEDAILALVTKSANDVAAAMAEHLGGTESNFGKIMTAKARQIGMKNTTFVNASGLHDPRQISSARDMAIMARTMIRSYPTQYRYFSTRYFTYKGATYRNHNRLMETYKGMDGLKTGYVNASGFNLVASAVRGDRRLIGVVFGGRSTASRNAHMASILDAGFSQIGAPENARIAEVLSRYDSVPIPSKKPVTSQTLAALNQIAPAATQNAPAALVPPASPEAPKQLAGLNPALGKSLQHNIRNGEFEEILGQGDLDPAASRRIETGLMAISAHKGEAVNMERVLNRTQAANPANAMNAQTLNAAAAARQIAPVPAVPPGQNLAAARMAPEAPARAPVHNNDRSINSSWAIQIGAFSSRAQTDQALGRAVLQLPDNLRFAQPIIVPTKRGDEWLFRARLNGYTESQALSACRVLQNCIPVKPQGVQ